MALRELTSNSIYEPRAENGCRVTSAYQRELWSPRAPPNSAWRLPGVQFSPSPAKVVSPRTPAGGVDESAEVEDASAERMTPGEYVGILQDTISSQKHLILLRSMAELDKHAIQLQNVNLTYCGVATLLRRDTDAGLRAHLCIS